GLDDDSVRQACAAVSRDDDYLVSPANFNSPGQVVVAGHADAVTAACEQARQAGARMAKQLAVSVPSHCGLMRPAAEQLATQLRAVDLRVPRLPVLHNVDAGARDTVVGIRDALVAQLDQSVLWSDSIRAMQDNGCAVLLECGPGKVLTGLNRRINKKLQAIALKDADGMRAGLAATA